MKHHAHAPNKESRSSMEPVTKRQQEAGKKEGQPVFHSPELPATSWASVASLLPRETITWKINAASSKASSQEDKPQSALEQVSKKKRKKKKSKKANDDTQVENCDTPTTDQKPPQFQDEGEFPDLALASVSPFRGLSNTTNLFLYSSMAKRHKENTNESAPQRDISELHLNKRKDQTTAKKPPPPPVATETKKGQKSEKGGGKKSKAPVQLDLGSMLAVLEQKQQSQKSKHDTKPVILSVGGTLPVVQKDPSAQKKHPREQQKIAHNPLDSTSPLVKKGKQREVPKAKKPTPLKRIILKEREERKQNRLLEEQGFVPQAEESSNPTEDQQETTVSEEDLQGQTGADRQMLDSPDTELYEGAPPEEHDPEQERDAEEIAEDNTHQEACLPCRPKIHSRKFRDYCSQMLSKDVDECVTVLLKELVRFQDRLYQKDPMKARMKRRLVMGLREVLKHLKLGKVKCVIISPNCERIQSKGGLDEALHTIIDTCREQNVPFVFALSRKALGRCVNKAVPVSLVGIFNYDGAQDHYHNMIELSSQARKAYEVMIANLENSAQEEQKIPVDEPSLNSPVSPAENEEPEYIKIWKKMLEKDCNHQLLNFEKQLATVCVAIDSGLQMDEEEGS
ncbi:selenocysteine insertion sequence-binding protein 2-like isoform X1 [Anguilla rostrata]|uniref:selenocysteine insertion sequence-binding protein 2-like isoform X1 n=2 Tax=Anguilla rostrata TaxID=7938 RepID=UPI0030CC919A